MPQSEKRPIPKHFGGAGPQMLPEFPEVLPGQLSPGADDSTTFHETPQHLDLSLTSSPLSEHPYAHSSTAGHFPFEHDQQGHRSATSEDLLSRSPHARAWNMSFPAEDPACDLPHSLVVVFFSCKGQGCLLVRVAAWRRAGPTRHSLAKLSWKAYKDLESRAAAS